MGHLRTKRIQRTQMGLFVALLLSWGLASSCTKQVRSASSDGGHHLGPYKLSVYWLAHERWYRGAHTSPLYARGKRVAWVSRRFAKAVRLQGSGILRNGWLVQYAGRCRSSRGYCVRVRVLSRKRYPSGVGAAGVPLRPLRSLAVDTRQIAFGTRLYIPALGRILRRNGRRHDGCFVAHDRGGKIKGARLDLFAGRRTLFRRYLKGHLPDDVQVYINHSRCRRQRLTSR